MTHFRIESVTHPNHGTDHYIVRLDTDETVGHAYKDLAKATAEAAVLDAAGPLANGYRRSGR